MLFFLLFLSLFAPTTVDDAQELELRQKIGTLNATIETITNVGSGVVIHVEKFEDSYRHYIITSNHVIGTLSGKDGVIVKFYNSSKPEILIQKGIILLRSTELDIVLLYIDSKEKLGQVSGFKTDLQVGEKIYAVGSPMQVPNLITSGYLSSLYDYIGGDRSIFVGSIQVAPGSSGGPVFDKEGNLIGIVKGMMSRTVGTQFTPFTHISIYDDAP